MGDRTASERGSVLLLFPAAFLIVLVLGSIAIDAGVAFMRQRELAAAASAAINDGVTLATADALERGDGVQIDPARLEVAVIESLDRRGILPTLTEAPRITVTATDRIEVTLVAHVDYVIAPALPGGRDGVDVRATATARLVVDDG